MLLGQSGGPSGVVVHAREIFSEKFQITKHRIDFIGEKAKYFMFNGRFYCAEQSGELEESSKMCGDVHLLPFETNK